MIYFYAHYAFASITAHILAMFPPFLAVLLAKGAPIGLVVFAFACFANFSAGLTNYGTTPTPMFFAQGYVSLKKWWRVGAVVSVVQSGDLDDGRFRMVEAYSYVVRIPLAVVARLGVEPSV